MISRATVLAGQRTATVGRPLVARSGTRSTLGSTMVKGPGQKRSDSAFAYGTETSATSEAPSGSATWTISGSKLGLRLASKTRASATRFHASAPSPYTVSVGIATRRPPRMASAARSRSRADVVNSSMRGV